MKGTIVRSPQGGRMVVFRGEASAQQVHHIAEACIQGGRDDPAHEAIRQAFGRWNFRTYELDFTGQILCRVTYSLHRTPGLVHYSGGPIAIAPKYADPFELLISVGELNTLPSQPANPVRAFHASNPPS